VADAFANADDPSALLVQATRVMDAQMSARRIFIAGEPAYYRTRPTWTGTIASNTQALAWPRIGMFNRNGVAILETDIPRELKEATAELAGQLAVKDRTLDNVNAIQGITSAKAGSVSVSYGDSTKIALTKIVPELVYDLLVPSWLTEELMELAVGGGLDFEVITPSQCTGGRSYYE
jgi:hypothetical protein